MQTERQGIDMNFLNENHPIIRHAVPDDLDALMAIFDEARKTIAALGIDQWQDGYPNREVILQDMDAGRSMLVESDGEITATFALCPGEEPTYNVIEDGEWLTGNENRAYLAIHRVAIAVSNRGTGLSGRIIRYAEDCARQAGFGSLRIDTHKGNAVMRRMLEKNGFTYCGVIHLANGDPRVAYEKIINREESL